MGAERIGAVRVGAVRIGAVRAGAVRAGAIERGIWLRGTGREARGLEDAGLRLDRAGALTRLTSRSNRRVTRAGGAERIGAGRVDDLGASIPEWLRTAAVRVEARGGTADERSSRSRTRVAEALRCRVLGAEEALRPGADTASLRAAVLLDGAERRRSRLA